MKISSYGIKQSSQHVLLKHHKESFKTELNRVESQITAQQAKKVTRTSRQVEEEAKQELIDALMAYLDKRPFEFKLHRKIMGQEPEVHQTNNLVQVTIGPAMVSSQVLHETFEYESLHFMSTGQVTTETGESFDYSYEVSMDRTFYEKHEETVTSGFLDPLVLNLDGRGVSFDDKIIKIDLNMDGQIDAFHMVGQGNGYLAYDKNNNGHIDDGSELFGPESNHGFKDLAKYDGDSNGWIDENDLIFSKLKIWHLNEEGKETLTSLKDANIGAIYLEANPGQFQIQKNQETQAIITHSSIFLFEDGRASTLHEVLV